MLVVWSVALTGICVADESDKYTVWGEAGVIYGRTELMQHGLWVTGDVVKDSRQGLLFRADKPVESNTTAGLVYLAIPEDLAKTFGPICYRAAERQTKLRLHGTFLPHSGPRDPNHPSVDFVIWGIHGPDDPDELPPDKKTYFGPNDAIPGFTIIPKNP